MFYIIFQPHEHTVCFEISEKNIPSREEMTPPNQITFLKIYRHMIGCLASTYFMIGRYIVLAMVLLRALVCCDECHNARMCCVVLRCVVFLWAAVRA